MIFVGVDPGLDGALACVDANGDFLEVVDMPTIALKRGRDLDRNLLVGFLVETVGDHHPCMAVVEEQQAMPGQGVRSMFRLGQFFEAPCTALTALQIPFLTVKPAAWKRAMGIPPKAGKGASVQMAQRLWPNAPLHGPRGGARDGRAEALLLAEWGRRQSGAQNRPAEAREDAAERFSGASRGGVPGKSKNA